MKPPTRKSILLSPIVLAAAAGLAAASAPGDLPRSTGRPPAPPPASAASSGLSVQITAGHGRLGIAVLQVSRELRAHLGAPIDRGVLVDAVRPDSPAAHAGLRAGDVIVEVDGAPATSATDMLDAIADRKQGDPVAIAALRDRRRIELTATLADDPGPAMPRVPRFGRGLGRDLDRVFRGGAFGPSQRQLDDVRAQLDELARRLEELERR
jgi:membrane-associated protease RseP (regulator of RpoE activity)